VERRKDRGKKLPEISLHKKVRETGKKGKVRLRYCQKGWRLVHACSAGGYGGVPVDRGKIPARKGVKKKGVNLRNVPREKR